MRKTIITVIAVLALMVLATGSTLAGPKGTDRPFKGTWAGTTTVTAAGTQGADIATYTSASTGSLNATNFGTGTYSLAATQHWAFGSGCAGSPVFAADNGTLTLTSAKGTVSGPVTGFTCELAPFDNTTYGTNLTMTISGGTGRYATATGTIVITSTSTGPAGGPFNDSATMTGMISY